MVARAARVGEGWVELADGRRLEAQHVVLATGSGAGPGGWDWALRHRQAVADLRPGGRVVVRGGGLTGLEVATEIAARRPDLTVTIVDPRPVGSSSAGSRRRSVSWPAAPAERSSPASSPRRRSTRGRWKS